MITTITTQYPQVVCKPTDNHELPCFYGCTQQDNLEFLGRIEKKLGDKSCYGHQYCYSFINAEKNHAPFPAREGFWSSEQPLPDIGARVDVCMNDFGHGTVVAYFFEHDFIGIEVAVDKRPDWHVKQTKNPNPLVFGAEVKVLASEERFSSEGKLRNGMKYDHSCGFLELEFFMNRTVSWKIGQDGIGRVRLSSHPKRDTVSLIAMEGYEGPKRWQQQEVFMDIPFERLAAFVDETRKILNERKS